MYYRGDGYSNFDVKNIKNVRITDMDLGGRALTELKVKTTKCDDTCSRFKGGEFCSERRLVHETRKFYRRRMLRGVKKYPVCLLRRDIAKETGCLRKEKKYRSTGTRRHRTVDVPMI